MYLFIQYLSSYFQQSAA